MGFAIKSILPLPVLSLHFMFIVEDVSPQVPAPATMLQITAMMESYLSGTMNQNKLLPRVALGLGALSQQEKANRNGLWYDS